MERMKAEKFALVSVYDKTGVVDLAKELIKNGYTIISTGGTAKTLKENGISFTPIQEITGNPEAFDGRMKTISFQIESGILFDRTKSNHVKEAKRLGIKPIDMVVCNLYPFEKEPTIENIDVGGPTMIRAAAKNFSNVIVLVDPSDYKNINPSLALRQKLATKAFSHLTVYDSLIAKFLGKDLFPHELTLPLRKVCDLRYGENPHQKAAFYIEPRSKSAMAGLLKIAGRDLSLVNVTDINAGLEAVRLIDDASAVVIKHNSPCGIAIGKTMGEALDRAIAGDPESAFGGIIVVNRKVDLKTAMVVADFKKDRGSNIDIFAAPAFDKNAVELLTKTRKTMGIYTVGKINKPKKSEKNVKFILGGAILQTVDFEPESYNNWRVVTKKKPTKQQWEQMKVAWKFISRIRSNSIIVMDTKLPMTRGIGSGQTSRVRSTKIALEQAGKFCEGAILASDSFFPFPDSVELAAKAGIVAIIQQGGSINDQMSIDEANKNGMVMVMTGQRAFWH